MSTSSGKKHGRSTSTDVEGFRVPPAHRKPENLDNSSIESLRDAADKFLDRLDNPEKIEIRDALVKDRAISNYKAISKHYIPTEMKHIKDLVEAVSACDKAEARRIQLRVVHALFLLRMDSYIYFFEEDSGFSEKTWISKRRRFWLKYDDYAKKIRHELWQANADRDKEREELCKEIRDGIMRRTQRWQNVAYK
jgi:hypothetical protein